MGHYNKEYERYYKMVTNNKKVINKSNKKYDDFNESLEGNYKRNKNINLKSTLIITTIGSLVLGGALLLCKYSESGNEIYLYMKKVCSTNFYYKDILEERYNKSNFLLGKNKAEARNLVTKENDDNIELKPFNDFQIVKNSKEDILKESNNMPLENVKSFKVINNIKENHILVSGEKNKVKSLLDGQLKEIGEDKNFGKFILLDHGDGVEIKYANLKQISLSNDKSIKEGECLGEYKNDKDDISGVIIQILINGQLKNPKDYLKFK